MILILCILDFKDRKHAKFQFNWTISFQDINFYFVLPFFFVYLPSPNLGITPQEAYNTNARWSDACRGRNGLWTRTLDRYTRGGLPECVVSKMSGPPPETTQDRTQRPHANPRTEITIPHPTGNRTRAAVFEDRDSIEHTTGTDY